MELTGPDLLIAAAQRFIDQGVTPWASPFQDFVIEMAAGDEPLSSDDLRPHEKTAIQVVTAAAAVCVETNNMRAFNDIMGTLLPWVTRLEHFVHMMYSRTSDADGDPMALDKMPWE